MRYIASKIGIDGEAIRDLMIETVEHRFGKARAENPVLWLIDNESCYTAKETVLFGRQLGLDIRTTPAYSPESNGMAETFVKMIKRDYVWCGDLKDNRGNNLSTLQIFGSLCRGLLQGHVFQFEQSFEDG